MLLIISLSILSFLYLVYLKFRGKFRLFKFSESESVVPTKTGRQVGNDTTNSPLKTNTSLQSDKTLYHCLQNLEKFPQALYAGRIRLLSLLDETVSTALAAPLDGASILSISKYSPSAIYDFFANAETRTVAKFDAYILRRRQGGGREMFPDLEYAKWWLRTAAPVKYVDGSWLGGIHRAFSTLPLNRHSQKIAWQILSEELGDGDLTKNHVWVYQQLMASVNVDIGTGDEKRFIDDSKNPNEDERVWKAAVAQLCVSLCPDEFLPEILGFNMAYENLPLHLLITIQELRELNLDPYYFILHVSIDNGHSGHAAMGIKAVTEYVGSLPPSEVETAWRRIQAGVILSEGLPTIPSTPSTLDRRVEKLFGEKCITARPMHAYCPAKIGGKNGKSLSQWLKSEVYHTHSLAFLRALAESKWVLGGFPEQSKLIKEMEWGGRMFGAFTSDEIGVLRAWIKGLGYSKQKPSGGAYAKLVGGDCARPGGSAPSSPIAPPAAFFLITGDFNGILSSVPISGTIISSHLYPLLRLSAVPFEYLPSYPAKCSTPQGMVAIKILRALHGFRGQNDLCAGMDGIHYPDENRGIYEISEHSCVFRELNGVVGEVKEWLSSMSRAPAQNYSFLLGAQLSFVVNLFWNDQLLEAGMLGKPDRKILRIIGDECVSVSREVIGLCDQDAVANGFGTIRSEIGRCVVDAGGGNG
ncbi:hypothetical protein Q9L58_004993 [Maublancomyces gigas]|uniref:Uncharacterized protein n=1 Tax=Discina gigas TaxID=1032678 RepID=A0ABR3GK00_9PEZI